MVACNEDERIRRVKLRDNKSEEEIKIEESELEIIIPINDEIEKKKREAKKLEESMVNAFPMDVPFIAEAVIGNNFAQTK